MHDQLSVRLASILFKLNQGEKLEPHQLAEEFSVDVRTIQRDLNVRLSTLPIQKEHGRYQLEPSYLGRLDAHSLRDFALLAGVKGLFPKLDTHFIKQLIRVDQDSAISVHGHKYEAFNDRMTHLFSMLDKAITDRKTVSFTYHKSDNTKQSYSQIHPYRLTNSNGIWYLSAADQGMLKNFSISKIHLATVNTEKYILSDELKNQLTKEETIWLGEKQTVTVEVSGKAIQYFKRRDLLPQQKILAEADDKLTLTTKIRHQDQLLPIVQYWIPFVRIIEPKELQKYLLVQLDKYLNSN